MQLAPLAETRAIPTYGPFPSVLATVGRTPIVRLNNIGPGHVSLYAKLESFNPMGSVKDRMALAVIETAERDGRLRPGQTVVEATSGNTGIALAMVCAQKRYPLVIVMAENFSLERRKLLRMLGAQVVLTPAAAKATGMLAKARALATAHGWFLADQFAAPANAAVHEATTAAEILADFGPDGLDAFVSGYGTGGTLLGVGRALKARSPATRVIVAEPDNAQMLASGMRPGQDTQGLPAPHPAFRPHPMQGWSPDFISPIAAEAADGGVIDAFQPVSGAAALATARDLAAREGILAGITGGATLAAAIQVASRAPEGAKILAMLPDTGERYLSTPLFEHLRDDMTAGERRIADSVPDAPSQAATPTSARSAPKDEARAFVDAAVNDPAHPVVLFALAWCEFCWSVRKLFDAAGIAFRSIDLDDPGFPGGGAFAAEVRAALAERAGAPTIPQIFVGGTLIGGASETMTAFDEGRLAPLLAARGITVAGNTVRSARDFLPGWLAKAN